METEVGPVTLPFTSLFMNGPGLLPLVTSVVRDRLISFPLPFCLRRLTARDRRERDVRRDEWTRSEEEAGYWRPRARINRPSRPLPTSLSPCLSLVTHAHRPSLTFPSSERSVTRRDTQWRDEWSTWGKDGDRKWVTMTRRKQVSDRLHPPPAQPMMRKEPYASHLSWGFRLFRSSFSCLGSSGSLLSLPLRLTSLTLLAPLIIRAAGEWNEPKGTEGERSETRDGWLARARVTVSPSLPSLSPVPFVPSSFGPSRPRSFLTSVARFLTSSGTTGRKNDGTEWRWKGTEDDRSPATRLSLSVGSYLPHIPVGDA